VIGALATRRSGKGDVDAKTRTQIALRECCFTSYSMSSPAFADDDTECCLKIELET
jgi:hypothetical protein